MKKFTNGEQVVFDSKTYGKGKAVVVGYHKCGDKELWIIYPKIPHGDFMCFLAEEAELISTPF